VKIALNIVQKVGRWIISAYSYERKKTACTLTVFKYTTKFVLVLRKSMHETKQLVSLFVFEGCSMFVSEASYRRTSL